MGLYENPPPTRPNIADSWLHLLHKANSSVNIAAFYFTLRGTDLGFAAATDSQVSEARLLQYIESTYQDLFSDTSSSYYAGKNGL